MVRDLRECAHPDCDVTFIPFMRTQRFCSRQCQRSFSDKGRVANQKEKRKKDRNDGATSD